MNIKTVHAVYFSGTGTTEKVVTTLAKDLAERLGAGYESGPEEKLLKEEKATLIREVLSSLNADDRTIILLRDYEKMAYADIARVTGLSETVVKVRFHRARLKYRSRYEQRGGDSCGL